uniref:DUF8018 domain-containing protein n=1 Tax=Solanum lycopersicum TaxID=4081 RepID=A0A3Q7IE82_SOLLC
MYRVEIYIKDLLQVKFKILRIMVVLDLTRDWLGCGAWALENSCTTTGEHPLINSIPIFWISN